MCPDGEVLALKSGQSKSVTETLGLTRAVQLWDTMYPGVAG